MPNKYDIIYQSQVSNGAQKGSFIYYDHLYIDDSWHHVALCNKSLWDQCADKAIQIPVSWNDNQVEVVYDRRHFDDNEKLYVYVVDVSGNANDEGFLICPECPSPPQFFEPK